MFTCTSYRRRSRNARSVRQKMRFHRSALSMAWSVVAATDQAMLMADRWNRIFCRTLRALRDLRRFDVHVNINGPGQINIGRATEGPE